ncbi:MAG: peptidase M48 [Comamonadaceae bacterium]|nr:MAG: peptidase M48 [Comamonadaceae bacterium]
MSLSTRSRRAGRNLLLVVATAAALASFSWPSQAQLSRPSSGSLGSLPSLGDSSELPAGEERRIGERIATSIYRDPDYIDDAVLGDYVDGIWQPLLAAARSRGELGAELDERFAWQLFLIRDRTVNAFALPGGYFGLHLGLMGIVTSRDELAAVLGHEISHVTQRHISRLITQQSKQAPWLIGAMILGALAASKSPDAANAAIVGGQAVAVQGQLNFSRDMEREADRVGFGVMTDAGFESRGVGTMFEKLQQAARLNDNGAYPYLRSHPLTTQRIAEVQARLQTAPPGTKKSAAEIAESGLVHAMMSARARVLANPGSDMLNTMLADAQNRASTLAPATPVDSRTVGIIYAGALAAAKLRNFPAAFSLAEKLKVMSAGNAEALHTVALLELETQLQAGQAPTALAQIDFAKSTARADVLLGGRALLAGGRAEEVVDRLQTWTSGHPKDAAAWQLLATAYGSRNQPVRAIRADAESRFAQLDYGGALDRLRAAQGMLRNASTSADFVEGSIIDARLRQVDLLVKEQAAQDKLDR